MIHWIRELLGMTEDTNGLKESKVRQRQDFNRWAPLYDSIRESENIIRGERRRQDRGHTPDRRHG